MLFRSTCKRSFQTPAGKYHMGDAQIVNGRLIYVWYVDKNVHAWDAENGELLWKGDAPWCYVEDLRISGDGSRVFVLYTPSIWAWSILIGEVVWKMEMEDDEDSGVEGSESLIVDGSKVWACWPKSNHKGWDFGIPGSTPMELSNQHTPLGGRRLWAIKQAMVKDLATGEAIFQLSRRFENPSCVQCDGSYLVAGYESGEILILDLTNVK